ncbi:MAG: hypothetical protein JETT_0807 [Candidatus Jettenia ecosi]|uniref:Uncharacterized protein n=1 Tax=Candidatus Jettenia ecosi TaxID=2494326 RepID=A0A533QDT4_9BACT|nr:MAG: hypothetical protein JETT_0807 [Candidatus Jettenia ecosi]
MYRDFNPVGQPFRVAILGKDSGGKARLKPRPHVNFFLKTKLLRNLPCNFQ